MKILLAYDGSECAKSAIADLPNAGIPVGSRVLVYAVGDVNALVSGDLGSFVGIGEIPFGSTALTARLTAEVHRAKTLAEEGADLVANSKSGLTVETDYALGSPANEICERARTFGAELIVLGSHGKGMVSRILLGSVSLRVLHAASCSVRIVRLATAAPIEPLRILLAYDGSPDSDKMIAAVLARQWKKHPSVTLVHVDELAFLVTVHGLEAGIVQNYKDVSETMLQKPLLELQAAGFNPVVLRPAGHPLTKLLEIGQKERVHTIYLGARGHGMLERIFLGSVTHGVATRSQVNVEVIR